METEIVQEFFDSDGHALPMVLIDELYSHLEYARPISCWIKVLQQTGCRINETQGMRYSHIKDGYLYWRLGKNQTKHYRRELLSKQLLAEIEEMRRTTRVLGDNLFPCKPMTFRRMFNKYIFPKLGKEWHEKRVILNHLGLFSERRYQLKGFRKNFQTILFYHYWQKYNDPGIAIEMVSKRMKHSSKGMTIKHYIENVEQLNVKKYINKMPFEWIKAAGQSKLFEFIPELHSWNSRSAIKADLMELTFEVLNLPTP